MVKFNVGDRVLIKKEEITGHIVKTFPEVEMALVKSEGSILKASYSEIEKLIINLDPEEDKEDVEKVTITKDDLHDVFENVVKDFQEDKKCNPSVFLVMGIAGSIFMAKLEHELFEKND